MNQAITSESKSTQIRDERQKKCEDAHWIIIKISNRKNKPHRRSVSESVTQVVNDEKFNVNAFRKGQDMAGMFKQSAFTSLFSKCKLTQMKLKFTHTHAHIDWIKDNQPLFLCENIDIENCLLLLYLSSLHCLHSMCSCCSSRLLTHVPRFFKMEKNHYKNLVRRWGLEISYFLSLFRGLIRKLPYFYSRKRKQQQCEGKIMQ
jgi:hypothetical protein